MGQSARLSTAESDGVVDDAVPSSVVFLFLAFGLVGLDSNESVCTCSGPVVFVVVVVVVDKDIGFLLVWYRGKNRWSQSL